MQLAGLGFWAIFQQWFGLMVSHLANERCQVLDTLFLSAGTLASDASAHEWTAEAKGKQTKVKQRLLISTEGMFYSRVLNGNLFMVSLFKSSLGLLLNRFREAPTRHRLLANRKQIPKVI